MRLRHAILPLLLAIGCVLATGVAAQETGTSDPRPRADIEMTVTPGKKLAERLELKALRLSRQGNYEDAEPLFRQAVAALEATPGARRQDLVRALSNLGWVYHALGRNAKAESTLARALELEEKVGPRDRPEVAPVLEELGMLYQTSGRYKDAEAKFERALRIRRKAYGENDVRTASSLEHLALNHHAIGRPAKAESLYQQVIRVVSKTGQEDRPEMASALLNLAWLYHDQGRHAEARAAFERALRVADRLRQRDHRQHTAQVFQTNPVLLNRSVEADSSYEEGDDEVEEAEATGEGPDSS